MNSLAIGSIAIDATAHTSTTATIYLGTGEANGSGDSYAGVGVYKSTDSGATWTLSGNAEFRGRAIGGLVIDRTNSNRVIAASASGVGGSGAAQPAGIAPRGIYLSTDAGATWACTTCGGGGTDNNRYGNLVQDPKFAANFWAAGWQSGLGAGTLNGGVVKSTDSGATWTQVGGTGTLPAVGAAWGRAWITVGALPADVNATYYLGTSHTNAGQNPGRIFKSVDGGVNWVQLASANGYCMGQCFYDLPFLWVQPNDPQIIYHGGAGAVARRATHVRTCGARRTVEPTSPTSW